MNTQDMYTREKNNQIHLDEMHRDVRNHHLLKEAKEGRASTNVIRQSLQIVSMIIKKIGTGLVSVFAQRHVHRTHLSHHAK